MTPNYEPLWRWVVEREKIRLLKERGHPQPWTDDPIFQTFRFCNVRREDDRVTRWIRDNIRQPFAVHPYLWLMLCIARQINWPDTLQDLIEADAWPDFDGFHPARITAVLNDRKARGEKIYTGAYTISAPSIKGANKQAYIAETVIGQLWARRNLFRDTGLRDTHWWLMRSGGWGNFMAYQAVVDMRFTKILRNAHDRFSWAAAGPGTIRGLNRVHGRDVKAPLSQTKALEEIRVIYNLVLPNTRVATDFSDVPNILCELDKYLRVKNGEGEPRSRYVPGRGS